MAKRKMTTAEAIESFRQMLVSAEFFHQLQRHMEHVEDHREKRGEYLRDAVRSMGARIGDGLLELAKAIRETRSGVTGG